VLQPGPPHLVLKLSRRSIQKNDRQVAKEARTWLTATGQKVSGCTSSRHSVKKVERPDKSQRRPRGRALAAAAKQTLPDFPTCLPLIEPRILQVPWTPRPVFVMSRSRFYGAAGSANETRAALRLATAWGYLLAEHGARCLRLLDEVVAMLGRLSR
jgi:hypothetical protein